LDFSALQTKLPAPMPALRQLLAAHGHLLVLDAASTVVQTGVLTTAGQTAWKRQEGEAGTTLFTCAEAVLAQAGLPLDQIGAFVYCEGPGSMLGVRTAALSLRTWNVLKPRPVFAYQSLAVAARAEWQRAPRAFTMIADARRDTWHALAVAVDGRTGTLQRTATADLPAEELVTPEKFRAWSQLARPVRPCGYDLGGIMAGLLDGDFFRPVAEPDAFQHEAPEYKKWSAQVHRAATAPHHAR